MFFQLLKPGLEYIQYLENISKYIYAICEHVLLGLSTEVG